MSAIQKEAVSRFSMGRIYQAIRLVFDSMPDRFKTTELLNSAGLKNCPPVLSAVVAVLNRDFKCVHVGYGSARVWKKPAPPRTLTNGTTKEQHKSPPQNMRAGANDHLNIGSKGALA